MFPLGKDNQSNGVFSGTITSFSYVFNWSDVVSPIDCMYPTININLHTKVDIEEAIYFKRWRIPDPIPIT